MLQVYPAEPYRLGALHSLGRASYMLLRQQQFPDTYDENEPMHSGSSDRCEPSQLKRLLIQYAGRADDTHVEEWFRSAPHIRVKTLVQELLDPEVPIFWSGYRVTASIGGNGHTVWHFELFSKRPESGTAVYTGDVAPNVLPGPRPA